MTTTRDAQAHAVTLLQTAREHLADQHAADIAAMVSAVLRGTYHVLLTEFVSTTDADTYPAELMAAFVNDIANAIDDTTTTAARAA